MILEIPNELDELIESAAARQGQDVHNFAVAALKREATNGSQEELDVVTKTKAERTLPESAEPGTARHVEFLAAMQK